MVLEVRRADEASLHDEWAKLLARHAAPAPFLHPTWHRVWLEEFHSGRKSVVLSVHDDASLVGVAPLLREGARLTFAGDPSICDYMDVVHAPERAEAIFGVLLDALQDERWSELDLWGLRDGSPTIDAFAEAAEAGGFAVERELETHAPRVALPGSWEEYLTALPKKARHELRRKLRRFSAAGQVELCVYTTPTEVELRLPTLLRFMVESRLDKAAFLSEQMARFFHRMASALAEEGLVRLYELELNGRVVASVLCFDQGGALSLYNSGYDPAYAGLSPGIVSKALCLKDAIESGRRCVDFLRGREPYKHDLGGHDQPIYRLRVRR